MESRVTRIWSDAATRCPPLLLYRDDRIAVCGNFTQGRIKIAPAWPGPPAHTLIGHYCGVGNGGENEEGSSAFSLGN